MYVWLYRYANVVVSMCNAVVKECLFLYSEL